ncbi:uncharacterized protein BYT42DRAFT_541912 [Radiomyces spectabilis]|uniref:uncharacterized protein n=1 Tax=Radiomyces spectabilis TaxID=64574 RepID=UPI00221FC04D|nr:uncharacterized protein BYT42DRAFT_541912 [Radiomyces spectabilis]KAI8393694.1 hypothetical protein BYT42DRAFT_541912 [Radiomyces spectabilis]
MYFHSASSRREQYHAIRSKRNRPKTPSHAPNTSGVDSGYGSASSSPTSAISHSFHTSAAQPDSIDTGKEASSDGAGYVGCTTEINVSKAVKAERKKKRQPPRQHDLVYSCPRPLAFPFHNDCHFLPVAEADPRDVARVAPKKPISPSMTSSKTSTKTSFRDFRTGSASLRSRSSTTSQYTKSDVDADSAISHRTSILSSVQQGTVRSLRSLFQVSSKSESTAPSERLPRLEVKKGTVESLRKIFSKRQSKDLSSTAHSEISAQSSEAAIITPRDNGDDNEPIKADKSGRRSAFSPSSLSAKFKALPSKLSSSVSSSRKHPPKASPSASNEHPNPSIPSKPSILGSSFFGVSILRKKAAKDNNPASVTPSSSIEEILDNLMPRPPMTPPQSSAASKIDLSSSLKNLSSRLFATSSHKSLTDNQHDSSSPQPRHGFGFPSPRRSKSTTHDDLKKQTHSTEPTLTPTSAPTRIGRFWKTFKNMITGHKSSRVGIL